MRLSLVAAVSLVCTGGCSSKSTAVGSGHDLSMPGDLGGSDAGVNFAHADLAGLPLEIFDLAGQIGSDGSVVVTSDGGLVEARPYNFYVPAGYDASQPTPLVVMLHGYSANGVEQELYWNLKKTADEKVFLYAYPDGTPDTLGNRFWNATDACCNFNPPFVDDVAYLNAVIDDVQSKYNVDPKRIFVTGHSNGGFMSHRTACDAPRVAAVASLAGAQWNDASKCQPSGAVSVLEVHGSADVVIVYNGGQNLGHAYPSAPTTVADWASKNGCTPTLNDTGMTLDIDAVLPGAETKVQSYGGCRAGGAVELWTIQGGAHVPTLQPTWGDLIYGFLSAHPKP